MSGDFFTAESFKTFRNNQRREGHMKTLREDGNVKMEAETGVMLSQTKENLGLPAYEKGESQVTEGRILL